MGDKYDSEKLFELIKFEDMPDVGPAYPGIGPCQEAVVFLR